MCAAGTLTEAASALVDDEGDFLDEVADLNRAGFMRAVAVERVELEPYARHRGSARSGLTRGAAENPLVTVRRTQRPAIQLVARR